MKTRLFSLAAICLLFLLAGCSAQPVVDTHESVAEKEGGSITGATLDQDGPGENFIFNVPIDEAGESIGVDLRGTLASGSITVRLVDADGNSVWDQTMETGSFVVNTVVQVDTPGEYRLGLAWNGPVQGQYNLMWQPGAIQAPVVTPMALIQGAGMMLVALGFILYAAVRKLGLGYLGLGALAWVVTVAVKFIIAIPLNPIVIPALQNGLPAFLGAPLSWIYIGILTGITEILLTYLFLRKTRFGQVSWEKALAFGIGFGAFEALLLGFSPLVSVVIALVSPAMLPYDALSSLAALNDPLLGMVGVWERFFTILVHILSNVLIFYAVLRREPKWFWWAFAYKSGIDAVAGFAQLNGNLESLAFLWTIEAVIAVFGIVGWLGTKWVGRRYREDWVSSPTRT